MKTKNKLPKVNVVTLGCSKNLVDSENIIAQLKGSDFDAVHEDSGKADIVIVNTCGFIESAKEESINTILDFSAEKANGKIQKLYVTGCLSQRYKSELSAELPEVNGFFGTMDMPDLIKAVGGDYKYELIGERPILTTAPHYAYLKIGEGCNRTCSFCAIPLMRGDHKSRSIEDLVQETKNLAAKGVKEIMLIAQELTYYGLDLYKKRALPQLLKELCKVKGIEWIRLHYAYPHKFPLEVIEVMRDEPKICNYLDMPLQHASNAMLKAMKRQITREETEDLIASIRNLLPDIALRTTMLVGFPGETDEDIEELATFIRKMRFDRMGSFTYSHEEGTTGYELEDNVSEEAKADRMAYIMDVQQDISLELNQKKIGKILPVLFDRKENNFFIGRTEFDSPEVDNEVLVSSVNQYVRIGDFANVLITDATEFDLMGKVVI